MIWDTDRLTVVGMTKAFFDLISFALEGYQKEQHALGSQQLKCYSYSCAVVVQVLDSRALGHETCLFSGRLS